MSPVALSYAVDGPVDAPALVLGPSLGTTRAIWEPILPELTRAFRVIRYDHRGHDGSRAPPGPYSIADLGADVVALLDRLGVERASYAGVSLGGMVGLWLATRAAARIDRLALICTSAFLPPRDGWLARAATVRANGMGPVVGAVVARSFVPSFAAREPRVVAQMALALGQVDPEGYASCCEAIGSWDLRDGLGAIVAPTLVIAGGDDPATPPSHAYAMGAGIAGARVVVVEGAAHLALLERPATVGRLLLDHLAGRSPGDGAISDTDGDRSWRGEAIRRAVLGDAHVDRARAKATAFSAPFQDLVNRFPWGDIWGRPGLSRAERSIVTLTVLAALHHEHELEMHVVAAVRNGLTPEKIREVLLHTGAYAGIPVANRALAVAERALEDAAASGTKETSMTPLDTPRVRWQGGDDIPSLVRHHARETPERVALVHGERTQTWAELERHVDRVARALVVSGARPGDRVAVLASNSLEYAAVFLGALRARACVVPLPTMASTASLAAMLVDSAAVALFVDGEHREVAAAIASPAITLRVDIDGSAGIDAGTAGFRSYAAWRDAAVTGAPALVEVSADDAFDVIYSSGTTGVPKGIVHSHGARRASYAGERARYFSRECVNVIATPFYSNTTSVTWLLTTAHGGTNVLLGKFSADAFITAVEKHRATHAMLVPVQYDRILASERFRGADLSSLRYLFSTSAPLRADTKRRILDETSCQLLEIYGLTEGGPVTVLDARAHPDKLTSVGRPSGGCTVRIVDDAGRDVPAGQVGEVLGRSANMMSGYLNRPDETEALLLRDPAGTLYFRTGDLGRFDEDGFLYLLDRKKDIIISGGFNVYATDIETVLASHPDVAEVAVIGVPSERWGETPLALVVARPGSDVTAKELHEYCNARVGKMQRVSGVELRQELPKNAIGKVLKRELKAPYWNASPSAHDAPSP
jgi:long-chain acyl-CoA synthetase